MCFWRSADITQYQWTRQLTRENNKCWWRGKERDSPRFCYHTAEPSLLWSWDAILLQQLSASDKMQRSQRGSTCPAQRSECTLIKRPFPRSWPSSPYMSRCANIHFRLMTWQLTVAGCNAACSEISRTDRTVQERSVTSNTSQPSAWTESAKGTETKLKS